MNKHAIKSGLILGIIGVVLTLVLYLINPELLAAWWVGISIFILFFALVIYFGIQYRNEQGGFLSFGQAWMYSFQLLIAAGVLSTIFNIVMYNVIDPELATLVADKATENAASMMQSFGMPEDQLDEALEQTRQDTLDRFSVSGALTGFLWGLIIYAIGSLITGAIIKKKEPEFEG